MRCTSDRAAARAAVAAAAENSEVEAESEEIPSHGQGFPDGQSRLVSTQQRKEQQFVRMGTCAAVAAAH